MYIPQNFILLPFHLPVSPSFSLYKCTDNICNEAYTIVIVVILWWWDLELFLHLPCVILELFEFYVTNSCFNKNNSFIYKKKTLKRYHLDTFQKLYRTVTTFSKKVLNDATDSILATRESFSSFL